MNILDALKQLRDDIKTWVTINLNALNAKIDEKTIPIDNELSATSTNPVQNKVITNAINNIPRFSGDYNDLTNAPDITEDGSGNMVIADESGNIIFKADADGMHTTTLTLNGEVAATEAYVDNVVANIDIPDVDFTGYATEEHVATSIEAAKTEISESIISESDEWKIVDNSGNIIFNVNAQGIQTTSLSLNGESAATEEWVESKNYITEHQDISGKSDIGHKHIISDITDLPNYATEGYVDTKVADLVNSAPETLDTLGELATALQDYEDAYDALLETVGSKATAEDLENLKSEISESIVSETDEFHIVDDAGNIIASIDANGITTTTVTAHDVVINGDSVEDHMDNAEIHVTTAEKEVWNNKSNFSGSYNDLTDKPEPINISNYYTKAEVDSAIENVEVDLTGYATEEYVTNAIDAIDFPETDLTNYYTKSETDTAIEATKEELSESIVADNEEWKVVDGSGNIIFSVDDSGAHTTSLTLNGESVEDIIDTRISTLVDSAPDTLNTLNELAEALGDNPNFATSVATEIGKKVDKVSGKDLSTNDFTNDYKDILDNLGSMAFEESDPTVPSWAKAETKPTYTAEEIGLGNVNNTSDADKPVSTATQTALDNLKDELSESTVSSAEEWTIVDNNGNVIATISANGLETTTITTQNIIINGINIITELEGRIKALEDRLASLLNAEEVEF